MNDLTMAANKVEDLTNIIFKSIKDFIQQSPENESYQSIGVVLSSLAGNISAFINSENAWDQKTKVEIIEKIRDGIFNAVTKLNQQSPQDD